MGSTGAVDMTVSDLEVMQGAVNYRRWVFEQIAAHLGPRVIEVGAGIGNYTDFLLDRELVGCVDVHEPALRRLRERFAPAKQVVVVRADVAAPAFRRLARFRCDTAVCLNVLEHVEDDEVALSNIRAALCRPGKLLLMVPAVPAVMGTVDRALGHYRRYTRSRLERLLTARGYTIDALWWFNVAGLAGWLWNNRIARMAHESPAQVQAYDRFVVPWVSRLERVVPPPVGLSLVCVASTN